MSTLLFLVASTVAFSALAAVLINDRKDSVPAAHAHRRAVARPLHRAPEPGRASLRLLASAFVLGAGLALLVVAALLMAAVLIQRLAS